MARKLFIVAPCAVLAFTLWAARARVFDSLVSLDVGPQSAVAYVQGDTLTLLFDNFVDGVNPGGSAPASQLDTVFPFDAGATDDFVLGESPECLWSVEGVRFQGVYWNGSGPGAISGFRVIFWPDTPDGPDGRTFAGPDLSMAAAVYEIPGSGGESATAAADVFAYEVALPEPFVVVPHERWWIQIQAVLPYPPQWGPAVTNTRQGETPYEYFDLLGMSPWTPIADPGDLAFQLMGRPKSMLCDDGNACTEDGCEAGVCVFTAVGCDDGNECTTDSCDPAGGCVNEPVSCDDGDACTTDSCDPQTGCTTEPVSCDDGNACTQDSCDPASGCVNAAVACDDGNACTTDSCDPATGCTMEPVICDDGDACTTDACDPASGCITEPVSCDDGDACTRDSCDPSGGCAHEPITCDDGDSCTTDACDPASGCTVEDIVCDDGDPCTVDVCDGGTCQFIAPPDFDGDGDVDDSDASVVLGCIMKGGGEGCECADLNGDGTTDLQDYSLIQRTFTGAK